MVPAQFGQRDDFVCCVVRLSKTNQDVPLTAPTQGKQIKTSFVLCLLSSLLCRATNVRRENEIIRTVQVKLGPNLQNNLHKTFMLKPLRSFIALSDVSYYHNFPLLILSFFILSVNFLQIHCSIELSI